MVTTMKKAVAPPRWGAVVSILVVCAAILGCSDRSQTGSTPPTKLTAAQRDSVTANSRLPGAGALKGALGAADSAAARAARANEAAK
jgi:hypothetical protein